MKLCFSYIQRKLTENRVRESLNCKIRCILEYLLKLTKKSLLYVITPGYYAFWSADILPNLATFFKLGIPAIIILFMFHTYLFVNVIVNMVYNLFCDTSVNGLEPCSSRYRNGEVYCVECDALQPYGSYHCSKCRTCILGRDLHCDVFESCIGQKNKRYFILYITYASIMCLSCAIWVTWYLVMKFGANCFLSEVTKTLFSIGPGVRRECKKDYNGSALFLLVSLGVVLLVGSLAYRYMKNAFKGLTFRERKQGKPGSPDWKRNMEKVFGKNWQVAVFWPFVYSPLPE